MKRIGVISDTHMDAEPAQFVERLIAIWGDIDLVLHAGDVTSPSVISALGRVAETITVAGNMDGPAIVARFRRSRLIQVEDCRIGLTHGDIEASNRAQLQGRDCEALNLALHPYLQSSFPSVQCIVFGHTHCPHNSSDHGTLFFNPGAFRFGKGPGTPTVGRLTIDSGKVTGEILPIPDRS